MNEHTSLLYVLNHFQRKRQCLLQQLKTLPYGHTYLVKRHGSKRSIFLFRVDQRRHQRSVSKVQYLQIKDALSARRRLVSELVETDKFLFFTIRLCQRENIVIPAELAALKALSSQEISCMNNNPEWLLPELPLHWEEDIWEMLPIAEERSNEAFFPMHASFTTQDNKKVRSKSELLIANTLANYGIPYLYEPPLSFDGRIFHPDFAAINARTRQPVLWEHFGMMDNESYRQKAFSKIEMYGMAGFLLGKNLIITYESENSGVDTIFIEGIIQTMLM